MDRLTEINAFTRVVQTGSFAEAARQMNVSSTIVSRHVRELEAWLGVRLLNRTTRHVALTEIGHVVYERCTGVLEQFQVLEETADDWRGVPRGTLRVSGPLVFGGTIMAAKLAEFMTLYPRISVDLNLTDRYVDIVEEGLDVAVVLGDLPDSSALTRILCQLSGGIYASPAYLNKHGRPAKIDDLVNYECILHPMSSDGWSIIDEAEKTHSVNVSGRLRTNSAIVIMSSLIQGQGIGLLPNYLAEDAVAAGTLERLLPNCKIPPIAVRAVYHPGRHQAAKLPVFIDFLVASFASYS